MVKFFVKEVPKRCDVFCGQILENVTGVVLKEEQRFFSEFSFANCKAGGKADKRRQQGKKSSSLCVKMAGEQNVFMGKSDDGQRQCVRRVYKYLQAKCSTQTNYKYLAFGVYWVQLSGLGR